MSPTGYTAAIYEGKDITFRDFALGCARAFGALIEMRDDPQNAPIPEEFTPSTSYHEEALVRAGIRLGEAWAWSDEDADREAEAEYIAAKKSAEESQAEARELRGRYRMMLAQVELWEPPSVDHVGLKEFMAEQLRGSIDFDTGHVSDWPAPQRLTGTEYRAQAIEKAKRDIASAEKNIAEEIERTESRNKWVKQLRDSL